MDVYWFEQTEDAVLAGDEWLTSSEVARLSALAVPKRRVDWRLGRCDGEERGTPLPQPSFACRN